MNYYGRFISVPNPIAARMLSIHGMQTDKNIGYRIFECRGKKKNTSELLFSMFKGILRKNNNLRKNITFLQKTILLSNPFK